MKALFQRNRQLVSFLLIGIVNTLFGYSIYATFLYIGLHYAWAGMLSTILGIMFNFKSTGIAVFQSTKNVLIFRFASVYGIIYCLSTAGVALLHRAGISPYYGGAIMLLPMAALSFVLNKHFVFNK